MNEEHLRDQIDQLIRNEIQGNINEFVDMKEQERKSGLGFVSADDNQDLTVKIPKSEVDKHTFTTNVAHCIIATLDEMIKPLTFSTNSGSTFLITNTQRE